MSSNVLSFLTRLATEPETMGECMRDPNAAMEAAGLDADARAALISCDSLRIHAVITGQPVQTAKASEKSCANAKLVADVLASDPAVAQWLQSYYYQSMQTWPAAAMVGAAGMSDAAVMASAHSAQMTDSGPAQSQVENERPEEQDG